MNILVIGITGRVGSQLAEKLLKDGHEVTGASRQVVNQFDAPNYSQIKLDVTASIQEIEHAIPDNTDAIYFVTGSRGKNLLQVDLHGAVKTMQVAEKKGIKRYILLSALFSLQPDKWDTIIDYYTAKYFADLYLIHQTDLDYTIIQPGYLTETKGSGKITVAESKMDIQEKISIPNVAAALKEVLDKTNTFKKRIPMLDGDTSISEAIEGL